MKEFMPCRKCGHDEKERIPNGYYMGTDKKSGMRVLLECEHHKEWRLEHEAEKKFIKSGFDATYFDANSKTYEGHKSIGNLVRLLEYMDKMPLTKSCFLYFHGKNGTQKTTVSHWIGASLIKEGYNVQYCLMKTLVDLLWRSEMDEDARTELRKYTECDVLVLDEAFSKDKMRLYKSGVQLGVIDAFIRDRVGDKRGIIFISNNSVDEIEEQGFTASIKDLVKRECLKNNALFEWEDNYMDNVGAIPALF